MNKFNARLSAAVAMAAIIGSTLAPAAFADTTVVEEGNGAFSSNHVTVNNTDTTSVNQTNHTIIVNAVHTSSNTGGNDANWNTGGGVKIDTGNATTKVNIENTGSSNDATLPDCGCPEEDTTVKIKGNGKGSHNGVHVNNNDGLSVDQENATGIFNFVGANSNTGYNDANGNTGKGKTTIKTGRTRTRVRIFNTGSSNTLF